MKTFYCEHCGDALPMVTKRSEAYSSKLSRHLPKPFKAFFACKECMIKYEVTITPSEL